MHSQFVCLITAEYRHAVHPAVAVEADYAIKVVFIPCQPFSRYRNRYPEVQVITVKVDRIIYKVSEFRKIRQVSRAKRGLRADSVIIVILYGVYCRVKYCGPVAFICLYVFNDHFIHRFYREYSFIIHRIGLVMGYRDKRARLLIPVQFSRFKDGLGYHQLIRQPLIYDTRHTAVMIFGIITVFVYDMVDYPVLHVYTERIIIIYSKA